jgi:SAM-dependent methyltransferase
MYSGGMEEKPAVFQLDWSLLGIFSLLSDYTFETVLDIGSGAGEHARFFRHFGKKVYTVDITKDSDYVGDFMDVKFDRKFDVVFCSHVLEHQRNVGLFLEKIYDVTADDGIVMIGVPAHPRERLVPGHLTNWNAGLLCYNMIFSGFDCSEAKFVQTFDLNLIVRKKPVTGLSIKTNTVVAYGMDHDAIDPFLHLQPYFPFPVSNAGNAEVLSANWNFSSVLPFKEGMAPVQVSSKNLLDGAPFILRKDDVFSIES